MDAGTQTDNSVARPWRRLSDLLLEIDFMEVQLEELQHLAPAHQTRNLGQRIAACHRRLDELEAAFDSMRKSSEKVAGKPPSANYGSGLPAWPTGGVMRSMATAGRSGGEGADAGAT